MDSFASTDQLHCRSHLMAHEIHDTYCSCCNDDQCDSADNWDWVVAIKRVCRGIGTKFVSIGFRRGTIPGIQKKHWKLASRLGLTAAVRRCQRIAIVRMREL